jgi:hypothetical protein
LNETYTVVGGSLMKDFLILLIEKRKIRKILIKNYEIESVIEFLKLTDLKEIKIILEN